MRRFVLMACGLFIAGVVLGQMTPVLAGENSHEVSGVVVSVDTEGKTITFTGPEDEEMTMPVMDEAVETLEDLKAGDKVVLTCEDNEEGEHQGITSIKMAEMEKE